jgi:hypothetical protein
MEYHLPISVNPLFESLERLYEKSGDILHFDFSNTIFAFLRKA